MTLEVCMLTVAMKIKYGTTGTWSEFTKCVGSDKFFIKAMNYGNSKI